MVAERRNERGEEYSEEVLGCSADGARASRDMMREKRHCDHDPTHITRGVKQTPGHCKRARARRAGSHSVGNCCQLLSIERSIEGSTGGSTGGSIGGVDASSRHDIGVRQVDDHSRHVVSPPGHLLVPSARRLAHHVGSRHLKAHGVGKQRSVARQHERCTVMNVGSSRDQPKSTPPILRKLLAETPRKLLPCPSQSPFPVAPPTRPVPPAPPLPLPPPLPPSQVRTCGLAEFATVTASSFSMTSHTPSVASTNSLSFSSSIRVVMSGTGIMNGWHCMSPSERDIATP